jgi:hypothetical protein
VNHFQTSPSDPPEEVIELLTAVDMGRPVHRIEEPDKHSWRRQAAANRLGINESELADEPDNDAGSGEQAWA